MSETAGNGAKVYTDTGEFLRDYAGTIRARIESTKVYLSKLHEKSFQVTLGTPVDKADLLEKKESISNGMVLALLEGQAIIMDVLSTMVFTTTLEETNGDDNASVINFVR